MACPRRLTTRAGAVVPKLLAAITRALITRITPKRLLPTLVEVIAFGVVIITPPTAGLAHAGVAEPSGVTQAKDP